MKMLDKQRYELITSKFNNVDNILVLGDVGIDYYIYGSVDRISPEAPVPVLRVTKEEMKLGMAATICHNIYALGGTSSLVSIIGKDKRGLSLEEMLKNQKVNLDQLVSADDVITISKERILTKRQQICRVDYEQENPSFSDKNLSILLKSYEKQIAQAEYIILEDYSKGIFTEATTSKFISIANAQGKFTAVDPGRGKPASFYHGATLLKPNLTEAKELVHSLGYSTNNVKDMVKILLDKLDLQMLAITLGPEGMALVDKNISDDVSIIPTVANEVFDVSGAGDTVIGTMIMSLSAGASLVEAGHIANIAAGVVVSKSGTATVNIEELNEYYEYLKNKKI